MRGDTIQNPTDTPNVLFAILDWGLGHATRTWPLIVAARRLGAKVTVASRGTAGAWLDGRMAEWDRCHADSSLAPWSRVEKPGVTIRYAHGIGTLTRIAMQMPRFVRSISRERRWASTFTREQGVTHVFSDNCYGAWSDAPGVSNVLMSHQLHPPVPLVARDMAVRTLQHYARAFDAIWVPDSENQVLSGPMSAPISTTTRYVGPLSRFQLKQPEHSGSDLATDSPVLLGLVSGPEPQRSDMEAALRSCFLKDGRPALILAGRPNGGEQRDANVLTVNDADDQHFLAAMRSAETIVCRSGYSTLLDLVVLGRTAVLVPTVGQPEQALLAKHWNRVHGWTTLRTSEIADFKPDGSRGRPVQADGESPMALMQDWLQLAPVEEPLSIA